MVPHSTHELADFLVRTQLVSKSDLSKSQDELGKSASVEDLLDQLERKHLLTTFQAARIRKGETDGLVLDGCKLLYRNASGSFARVYRVCRISTGQMLGLKLLRKSWSRDPDTVHLFHREGEIGKRLKHPNIVPIFNTGAEGDFHYITMEFIEGGNLRDFINIRKKLAAPEACKYALDMARALEYALDQGVTHRDLKLTNVLMSSQGIAKLIDFGLAADDAFLTRPGAPELAQALEYATLEKGSGAPRNDPRSDLFFLGVILYELLTGESPYPRTRDRDERKRFGRYRDIRSISSIDPQLNWRVAGIVERLIQPNPELRYQTAGEVIRDLENILAQLGHETESQTQQKSAKSILCVEHRTKRQDVLREYFTKHGFRVLLLSDPDRALARLRNAPPDCLIFFGDSSGDRVVSDFQRALSVANGESLAVFAILSQTQSDIRSELEKLGSRGQVIIQPVRLRELRERIQAVVGPAR